MEADVELHFLGSVGRLRDVFTAVLLRPDGPDPDSGGGVLPLGVYVSASAAAVVVTLADDDVSFEDELARNPYVLKTWLQYIASKRMARAKVRDGERGGG